ncbi:hypothetical protein F5B21DRAFT_472190, partial [Xylaria acuta]
MGLEMTATSPEDEIASTVRTFVDIAVQIRSSVSFARRAQATTRKEGGVRNIKHMHLTNRAQHGAKLAVVENNTSEVLWWTSWAIGIVLGLFVLHLLVGVRAQLVKLNAHHVAFQTIWAEDKINEEKIRQEERRERHMQERQKNRVKTPRETVEEVVARIQAGWSQPLPPPPSI